MKRAFDVFVAATALVLLSPLMVIVALLVRVFLGKPVLFRQTRPGLHGQPFEIIKFRSMCDEFDADGNEIAVVREVIIGEAQDRLAVEARDGSKAEIPFVGALVTKVDIANDEIVVDLPEGLFEPESDEPG